MKKRQVAILDFGSSKLSAIVGEQGVNNTFVVKGKREIAYEGFFEGEFLDLEELEEALEKIIADLRSDCKEPFTRLYVGIPGEFVTVVLKEKTISYERKKKITQREVNELYDEAYRLKTNRYRIVNRSAIYFVLDDNRRIVNPIGLTSEKLGGYVSYSLADVSFERIVRPMLDKAGVNDVVFVSSALAESMYLFEPEQRDRFAMLLDVGHLTSTLVILRGDGLLYQKSIPFGGGLITADLCGYLNVGYATADNLKRKISISRSAPAAVYEISDGEEVYAFPAEKCNDVVRNNLDTLCESVEDCLSHCEVKFPENLTLYVTGGGVLPMRGCKEYIANRLNRVVDGIVPNSPTENKPTDSSKFGLLHYALRKEETENVGFLQKIFGRR